MGTYTQGEGPDCSEANARSVALREFGVQKAKKGQGD